MPKIALNLPVPGNIEDTLQRLERFLKNKVLKPTHWYKAIARAALALFAGAEIELHMDQTDLDDRFPMLFVADCFRIRAIPTLWSLLPDEGRSGFAEQKELLEQAAKLLPSNTRIVFYADREYGSTSLLEFLHRQGWYFVIRMKTDRWCKLLCRWHFQMQEVPLNRGTVYFESSVFRSEVPDIRFCLS